jgi:signal transduction histidine kinase
MSTLSLRRRVALAFTILGLLLSVLASIAAMSITEDYEYILATEILRGQAEDYSLRLANHLPAMLPETHRISGYTVAGVPPRYAGYPLGVHEDPADEDLHVGVFDTASGRLYFVMDLSDIEALERHLAWFAAAMVVFGTAISGWLGWLAAGRALAPVGRLAKAVDALPSCPRATRLQDTVSDDELGRLAQAIDAYQARLVEADAHEQAFFADASHELRTPIAVVQGAAEVLLDEPDADPARRMRLQRMERGMQELSDLLEAMFGIARRTPLRPEPVDAQAFLHEVLSPLAQSHPGLDLRVDARGQLQWPRREALLLLRGLARRLLRPASAGTLALRLDGTRLDLAFHPAEGAFATDPGASVRSDTGRAAALLDRLAQRIGWELQVVSPTHVRIGLSQSPTPVY